MLDLKKLDEELEKVLADETEESLSRWLDEKVKHDPYAYLGEGVLEVMGEEISSSFQKCTMTEGSNNQVLVTILDYALYPRAA